MANCVATMDYRSRGLSWQINHQMTEQAVQSQREKGGICDRGLQLPLRSMTEAFIQVVPFALEISAQLRRPFPVNRICLSRLVS